MDTHDQETREQKNHATADRHERTTNSNSEDRDAPITTPETQPITTEHKRGLVTSRPSRLMKASSMQSKRRDLHHN